MCGIAGFISSCCNFETLRKMGDIINHRGPDDTGYYYKRNVGMVLKRLSIIDINNGFQPAYSENREVAVILNGEIFNYQQLREELKADGHIISNNSDTAILPHMYEKYGTDMFCKLSGQFAIAIYDEIKNVLILARDRMGIIPLSFYHKNNEFIFASEIKSILVSGRTERSLSQQAFCDVFTFWSPQNDRTAFKDIYCVLPGEYLIYDGGIKKNLYYKMGYHKPDESITFDDARHNVEDILLRAVKKRLIGDVKVSAYLSGGLDSSLITAIAASRFDSNIEAFSIGFEDKFYDEYKYQKLVCDYLGIKQKTIVFNNNEIPELLKEIIIHTETPLLRAGPAPLYRLSALVRGSGMKVVLSGEGSDELFGGYDIFREVKLRDYINKHPESSIRMQLFKKVNQYSKGLTENASAGSLNYFYMHGIEDSLMASHDTRWRQFSFFERFFSQEVRGLTQGKPDYVEALGLAASNEMNSWTDIQRSQYLEITTFLSRYLLSSQGDRVSMANSVEVRFPFLDDELVEYCMSLNDKYKIRALNEKFILKRIADKYLPSELVNRKKFPYRSPVDINTMCKDQYVRYLLSKDTIKRFGLFEPLRVSSLLKKTTEKGILSERETMLLMGILTFHMLCDTFNVETIC